MKGVITLASNVIGYVVILAIFVGIMATMAMFWFNFQTIPTEVPEKATTCDFAYMLSLWDEATVYPNIFNKTFLETWSVNPNETANSIFENVSDYFLPRSDFFVHIADSDGEVYSLYVPPESKSVYKSCGEAYMSEKDFEKIKGTNLETIIVENGNIKTFKGEPGIIPRNKIHSICSLTTFMSDESDVEIGTMVAGLTTNLATKLREGIYRVGVKNESKAFYELGGYPSGCLVYGGSNEVKAKRSLLDFLTGKWILKIPYVGDLTSWIDEIISGIPFVGNIWSWFKDVEEDVGTWVVTTEVHAECGFNWGWDETTRVLSVIPSNLWKSEIDWTKRSVTTCEFNTKIPERIVEEGELLEKLCRPKEAHKHYWTFPGGLEKLNFFLRVGKVKDTWTEDNKIDFCESRCRSSAPWYVDKENCVECCTTKYSISVHGKYARSQLHLFNNMPDDAIDIEYIIAKDSVLEEHGIIDDVPREELLIISACDSWPTVSDCGTSEHCYGQHCVDYGAGGRCHMCSLDIEDSFCSPNYLEKPPSVDEGLYSCQNVYSPLWPIQEEIPECVPVILVNATFEGNEIGERSSYYPYHRVNNIIDCFANPNAEIIWKINATGLCCANLADAMDGDGNPVIAEDGTPLKECKEPTEFCPKMKLWSSINSSNVVVLDEERYIFEITQRVCRGKYPYNNAEYVSIVGTHPIGNEIIEYILRDSEVELTSLPPEEEPPSGEKSCDGVSISEVTHEIKHDWIGDDEIDIYVSIENTGTGYCNIRAFVYDADMDEKEHEPNWPNYRTVNAGQTKIIKLTSDWDIWGVSDLNGEYTITIENDIGDELDRMGPISVEENCNAISVSVTHEIKHDWIGDDEIDIYATIENTGTGYCNVQAYVYPKDATENIEYEPNYPNYRTVNAGKTEIIKLTSDWDSWGVSDLNGEYTVKIKDEDGNVLVTSDSILVEEENCDDTSISGVTHEIIPNSIPLLDDNIDIYVSIENTGTGYCNVQAYVYPKDATENIEYEPNYPNYRTVNAGKTEIIKLTSNWDIWWVTSLNGEYTVKIKDTDGNVLGNIWGPVSVP
ncbi:MAG: hypothetical protein KAT28_05560 [Candidatus Aenigmarchaeota archaeon]|nr:hypothetical protein [Candidatus Aenigmarchaeota archaeon]